MGLTPRPLTAKESPVLHRSPRSSVPPRAPLALTTCASPVPWRYRSLPTRAGGQLTVCLKHLPLWQH